MSFSWRDVSANKSNATKLIWHHVASYDWKFAPTEVASAEIGGGAPRPGRCALPHTTLYNNK